MSWRYKQGLVGAASGRPRRHTELEDGPGGFWARQEALSAKDRLLCPCAYSPALRCLNAVTERLPAHGQQGEAGDLLVVSTANTPRPVWPGGCSA
jgi:hypothetical protein